MGFNEVLLSKIQSELSSVVASLIGSQIVFDGEVAFYNYEWIKKQFDKDITPYALTLENSETTTESKNVITNQYSIGFLCKEKDRDEYTAIFDYFYQAMINYTFNDGGFTYYVRPTSNQSSVPFSEGSGKAEKRFEQLIGLEVVIVNENIVSGKNVVIAFGSTNIVVKSFKVLCGKANFAYTSANPYANGQNQNINKTTFVVETFVDSNVMPLLIASSSVNNIKGLSISLYIVDDEYAIWDDNASYDGYELAGEYNGLLTAYLYFTGKAVSKNPSLFKIDGLNFPILDYAISVKNITKNILVPNSNMSKEVYIGKARAYVLNVLKSELQADSAVYSKLIKNLMSDGEILTDNFLTLAITFGNTTYTKQVVVMDITDNSENAGVWKITLSEGVIL